MGNGGPENIKIPTKERIERVEAENNHTKAEKAVRQRVAKMFDQVEKSSSGAAFKEILTNHFKKNIVGKTYGGEELSGKSIQEEAVLDKIKKENLSANEIIQSMMDVVIENNPDLGMKEKIKTKKNSIVELADELVHDAIYAAREDALNGNLPEDRKQIRVREVDAVKTQLDLAILKMHAEKEATK